MSSTLSSTLKFLGGLGVGAAIGYFVRDSSVGQKTSEPPEPPEPFSLIVPNITCHDLQTGQVLYKREYYGGGGPEPNGWTYCLFGYGPGDDYLCDDVIVLMAWDGIGRKVNINCTKLCDDAVDIKYNNILQFTLPQNSGVPEKELRTNFAWFQVTY